MEHVCAHVRRLLAEHDQLRAMSRDLIDLLNCEQPPAAEILAECRWALARTMLRHLPNEDRYVYRRLLAHDRAEAVAAATALQDDLAATYGRFRMHSDRWTIGAAIADWSVYRVATRQLLLVLNDCMRREEEQLYPHLIDAPDFVPERTHEAQNFAGDAWAIRTSLGR